MNIWLMPIIVGVCLQGVGILGYMFSIKITEKVTNTQYQIIGYEKTKDGVEKKRIDIYDLPPHEFETIIDFVKDK